MIYNKDILKNIITNNLFDSKNRYCPNRYKSFKFRQLYPYFIKSLECYTQHLNIDSIDEMIYIIINNIEKIPTCIECNNKLSFINSKVGYRKYCSKECSYKSSKRIENSKNRLKDRYGENINSPLQIEKFKNKMLNSKKERYGNSSYNNSIKRKKTLLNKYSVDNPMKIDFIKSKYYNNDVHITQKHIDHIDEWLNDKKFIEIYNRLESIEDICRYFNITHFPIHTRARKLDLPYKPSRKDITIKNIGQIIEQYGYKVEYNNRSIIKPLEIDLVIRRNGKIIKCMEYNGIMFHSLGISQYFTFNNWSLYKDNLTKFISKDRIKLDKCNELGIELFILREDVYLNRPDIIDRWLNSELNYKILDNPIIYRFKTINNLEEIQYRVCNNSYTNSHCRRPNKIWSSRELLKEISSSIENEYRIYFDWIEII